MPDKNPSTEKASLWQVTKSVAASMFGVQSRNNHENDFQQSSFTPYLIIGIIFVTVFVVSLIVLINLILP